MYPPAEGVVSFPPFMTVNCGFIFFSWLRVPSTREKVDNKRSIPHFCAQVLGKYAGNVNKYLSERCAGNGIKTAKFVQIGGISLTERSK